LSSKEEGNLKRERKARLIKLILMPVDLFAFLCLKTFDWWLFFSDDK
jgi:hypothetical protein